MTSRKLVVFEHESLLGNFPAHALFERVKTVRRDITKPPRAYTDYEVTVDKAVLPPGITLHEMI
jgi:CRISPR-associated protein Csd2